MKRDIELNINSDTYEVLISPNQTLLDVLRGQLGLMGTKRGCDQGACGSCTVLVNGDAYLSCIMLAMDAVGKKIVTIEGLEGEKDLHPLQKAFVDHFAVQCGFCSPGMILSAKALLDKHPHPTEEDVRVALSGNLCRCTGYIKVVDAVMAVGRKEHSEDL
jgi:carbon-monoxide dehydrogenase small subunit